MQKGIKMSEMFEDYPDIVTIEDLQKMLRIGRNAAYGLIKDGTIKTIRVSPRKVIIPKTSVINFVLGY